MDKDNKHLIEEGLEESLGKGAGPKIARFALACLSGLIPFAGGAVGGAGGVWSEKEQESINKILATWLKLQEDEIKEIGKTMFEVLIRLDQNDENVRKRIESPQYLSLVKKCFRDWSAAESEQKRQFIRNLLANAAATTLTSDDVLRLFIVWIEIYSELHFKVISNLYKKPGITRLQVWQEIYGQSVREDSPEADLFKLIIHDLSMGHIIRQHREVDYAGNFIKERPQRSRTSGSHYYASAFDDEKEYELTNLGRQFVHYTMNEIVSKIEYNPDKST